MELIGLILLFLAKVAAGSVALKYVLQLIFTEDSFVVSYQWPISIASCFTVYYVGKVLIYPYYGHPWSHLPTFKEEKEGQIIFESPRGALPLKWFQQHPEAELIRMLGPFNLPNLICSGPESLRDVLQNAYDFKKSEGLRAFLSRPLGHGLIISEGLEHKKQRKALTPAFHIRRIRDLYSLMWNKTQILQEQLNKDIKLHDGVVEISEWASRLTLDIIGPTAMGRDFQSLENEGNEIAQAFLDLLTPNTNRLIFFAAHWVLPEWLLRKVPIKVNRDMDRICGFLRETCESIVHEKRSYLRDEKAKVDDFDILNTIIQSNELDDGEIVDQMMTFLAAGHETTATALTWACYLCAKYPHVQNKLRSEIRSTIPSSTSPITYDLLESMPYLNGVCEETQRLYPTVPMTIREAVKDTFVAGEQIPAGTEFLIIPYATNRHPKFWGEDADMIVPERWIDTTDDGTQRPNKNGGTSTNFAEITFLHGARSCIGRDFAKAELRCAVAGVIGKFELELHDPNPPVIKGVITAKPDGGMRLRMKPLDGW